MRCSDLIEESILIEESMDTPYLPSEVIQLIAISLKASHNDATLCSLLALSRGTRTALLPLIYNSLDFASDDALYTFLTSHLPTTPNHTDLAPALSLVHEMTLQQLPSHRTAGLVLAAVPALPHQRIFPSATHLHIPLQELLDLPVPPSTSYNSAKAALKQRQALVRLLDAKAITFLPSPRQYESRPPSIDKPWKCKGVLLDHLRQRGGSEDWIRKLGSQWANLQDVYWQTRPPGFAADKVVEGVTNHVPPSIGANSSNGELATMYPSQ